MITKLLAYALGFAFLIGGIVLAVVLLICKPLVLQHLKQLDGREE